MSASREPPRRCLPRRIARSARVEQLTAARHGPAARDRKPPASADLLKAAPRIVRGRPSPGKGAQDPSSSAPREAFGLASCPASRCDPSGQHLRRRGDPTALKAGDTGSPTPVRRGRDKEAQMTIVDWDVADAYCILSHQIR